MLPFFRTTVLLSNVFRAVRFSTSMETSPGTFLYFAYGSNLLRERIHIHNPSAVFKTIAKLQDFKLDFNFESKRWRGCVATITPKSGALTWGVVWQLHDDHKQSLDRQEGVDLNLYEPLMVEVVTPDGEKLNCRTYNLLIRDALDQRPSPQYKDVIIRGAEENALPQQYIDKLKIIETNGYSGKVDVHVNLKGKINALSAVYRTRKKTEQFCTKGYQLAFNHTSSEDGGLGSERWYGCGATIEPSEQDHVWGIVWQIDNKHLQTLDEQENVEDDVYRPMTVDVTNPSGTTISCRTYQMTTGIARKPLPSPQYLDVIVSGAYQNDMPRDYIEKLEAIEHNGNKTPVPIYEDLEKNGAALGKLVF